MKKNYLQYGCGFSAPQGWRNFDASPTLRFERLPIIGKLYSRNGIRFPSNVEYGDIVLGLPVDDASSQGVYCSHILEHLSLDDLREALKNTHRVLQEGAYFRIVVPDLEVLIANYIRSNSHDRAVKFIKDSGLGRETRPKGFKSFMKDWLGNSQHLWLWDYPSLEQELKDAGFINIRRASFGDAIDEKFNEVESEERWRGSLGIECKRDINA